MSERIDLPNGGWVEFRDPKEIRKGKYRKRLFGAVTNFDNQMVAGLEIMEAIAAQLITAWEVPYLPNAPLPSEEPAMLGELEGEDYDAVILRAKDARGVIFPDTADVDTAGVVGSPTRPASA